MAVIGWMDPGLSITIRSAELWYVECEAGYFSILFSVKDPYTLGRTCSKLAFEIYIDGKKATEVQLSNVDYQKKFNYKWKYECRGIETKISTREDTIKKFKFMEIQTTENTDKKRVNDEKKKLAFAGDIVIKLFRKSFGKTAKPSQADGYAGIPKNVLEESLKGKAISHGTSFGEEKPMQKCQRWDNDYKEGADKPISIFHFKYRSRAALLAEHIIPRDPSPNPPPVAVPSYEDLTPKEKVEAFAAFCRERGRPVPSLPEIKREPDVEYYDAPPAKKPCFIDLSSEDDDESDSIMSPSPAPTPDRGRAFTRGSFGRGSFGRGAFARARDIPTPTPVPARGRC